MSFENGVFVPHPSECPVAVAVRAPLNNGARGGGDNRSRNGRGREDRSRDNDSSNWRLRDGDGGDSK
jgi:hypothetical protein